MSPARRRNPLFIGLEAMLANALPALAIQLLMAGLLAGYYFSPAIARVLTQLAGFKQSHGLLFVVGAAVIAASILPQIFIVLFFQGGKLRAENLQSVLFTAPLWAADAIVVDHLYRGLAWWLGDSVSLRVVVIKILVDQFVFNTVFAAPYGVIAYQLRNVGFSWRTLRGCLRWEFYRDKIVPTLVTTWAVWIPIMAVIYSVPLALQFPMFSLALTFWVLLLTYMTNRFAGKDGRPPRMVPAPMPAEVRP